MNLAELLRSPEGKTLEYKRDLSSPEGVLKTLIAFSNTAGGILVIGVEDRTRKVRGVTNVLADEERLANLISDYIKPKLMPEIEIVPWRKLNVIAVQAYPSNTRPHYLTRYGPQNGVFVRVGSTNRRADTSIIDELKRMNQPGSFDERPAVDSNSEAIDFRAASELFAPYRALTPQALETLRVTVKHRGRMVPSNGGLILFGIA